MNLYVDVIPQDSQGNVQTGAVIKVYKAGETTNGLQLTEDSDRAGRYYGTIPDTMISKLYDIRITDASHNPYKENVNFGKWEWFVQAYSPTDGTAINFSDLTDIDSNALPDTIPNPVIILIPKTDRLGAVSSVSSSGFTIGLSVAGSDNPEFDIYITVGA